MGAYTIEKRDQGYLLFTITRNERRNAINNEVMQGIKEALQIAADPEIKALVITGCGDQAFSSGGDLSEFHTLHTRDEAYVMLSKMSEILYSLLVLPKPTVALINGAAVGGGCELITACDFRIARKGIKAGFIQGKQAITTGWGGGTILAEKLPASTAMKILMDADLRSAEQLKAVGFIDELYEDSAIAACENFLENLLKVDVSVLESYKKIWVKKWEKTKLHERINVEVQTNARLWESDAHHLYVNNFLQKKSRHH